MNTLNNFDVFKVYTYDTLRQYASVRLPEVPWTDTYWPLVNQGLAARWTDAINDHAEASAEEVKLGSFLKRFAAEAAKPQPDPLLSPAEKYDLVFQYRHGKALDRAKLQALAADLSQRDQDIRRQPQVSGKRPLLKQLYQRLFAEDSLDLDRAMSMTVNGWKAFLANSAKEKNKYLGLDSAEGADWSWEGHCHGWAPAATMTRPPAHAVMARIGAQSIFLSQGDLRGLVTKAWADSGPSEGSYFLGRRCYEGDDPDAGIPSDEHGRGYAGTLQMREADAALPFTVIASMPDMIPVREDSGISRLNVYQIRLETTGDERIIVERYRGGAKHDEYWVAGSFGELVKAMRTADPLAALHKPFKASLTGCWDTNPASFHELLVEQLGERQVGFVMDRTRTAQVWNQPIYSADFSIGDLVKVGAVADIASSHRAAGTAYLAQVHTDVAWIREPGRPYLVYDAGFDARHETTTGYDYTLEFDAQKRVIGGEWGTFDHIDPKADVPDFAFGFAKGSQPDDLLEKNSTFDAASIDYSGIIGPLLACSLDPATDGHLQVLGVDLPYKTCKIAKVSRRP